MGFKKDLPLTSSHWGTYRAKVNNGKVTELIGWENDKDPSPIGPGIVDIHDNKTRIDKPMIRKSWIDNGPGTNNNLRGIDPFVAVSWNEAENIVAKELNRVRENFGNSSIFGGSYGWASAGRFHHAQSQLHRFLNCIGGYTRSKFTYSFAAAEAMVPHILGSYRAYLDTCTSWDSIEENTELFVCFGGVPLKNGQIAQGGTGSHNQKEKLISSAKAGIRFVNLSPLKSDLLDEVKGKWLPLRPNTDVAIMLGLAHTLYKENLYSEIFIKKYTEGFDNFLPYLLGDLDGVVKDANWASEISEISSDEIISLARDMSSKRTMISVSWSLTRQDHGEQPFWAAIMLASMLGQIGLPGGGFGFGYSATNHIGGQFSIIPGAAFPQSDNKIDNFIPVARISDLLLNPGETFHFDGKEYEYPDIKLIYWAGGNPFHHHQDINKLLLAWQKPETIISNEWCWNSLAKYSDIILPCTTPLERQDIMLTPRDPYVISMSKLVEPFKEAKSDFDIFKGIAKKMDVENLFTEGRDEEDWQKWIYQETSVKSKSLKNIDFPSYQEFRKIGWFKVPPPKENTIMLKDFREDPTKFPLSTPSGKIEIFSKTVDSFNYDDCPGHPTWLEPCEWLGSKNKNYPLHLISNQPKNKLHSQMDHGGYSKSFKIKDREPIEMNSVDASSRGINEGDIVKLFNDRGACLAGVNINDNIRPGVVQISTGAWYDPEDSKNLKTICKHGNPNVLTKDKGTSKLGQGPIAHSCLIEVELVKDKISPVTAFDPPVIIRDYKSNRVIDK